MTKTKPLICLKRVGAAENRQQKTGVPPFESLVKAKGYALYSIDEWSYSFVWQAGWQHEQ